MAVALFCVAGSIGTLAYYGQAKTAGKLDNIEQAAQEALDPVPGQNATAQAADTKNSDLETFLLVGSDTREGVKRTDADYGVMEAKGVEFEGRRSDTIMLLRHNAKTGEAALLSVPRDLWVTIAGTDSKERVNTAYAKSTGTLVKTLKEALDIPINHYVEVNFQGFKDLVDAIGGVPVYFRQGVKDPNTGLYEEPSDKARILKGVDALRYTRSRHMQIYVGGTAGPAKDGWVEEGRSDFGRIDRQQQFLLLALERAQGKLGENPVTFAPKMRKVAQNSIKVSKGLNVYKLQDRFKDLGSDKLKRYTLPTKEKTIRGKSVQILLDDRAAAILAYFRGETDVPPPTSKD